MPMQPRDPDSAERLRVELSENGWYCQDLTPDECQVAALRALGIGEKTRVSVPRQPGGGAARRGANRRPPPGDASLIEVRGVRTRARPITRSAALLA